MTDAFKKGLEGLDQGPKPSEAAEDATPPPAGELPPHPSVDALRQQFGDAVLRHQVVAGDEHIVYVPPARNLEILQWLRDAPEHRYDFLQDLTAIDYGRRSLTRTTAPVLTSPLERFWLVELPKGAARASTTSLGR